MVRTTLFVHPPSNQLTVSHVRFLNVITRLNAHQLCHQPIHDVFVILRLVCFGITQQSELDQLRIGQVVESEDVCPRLFQRRTVGTQRIGIGTLEQLPRGVTQALVKIGVQVVGDEAILIDSRVLCVVPNEFLAKTVAERRLVVSLGDILNGDRLRAMILTDPVRVRQVDTDRSSRVAVSAQHGDGNHFGRDTLHLLLAEAGIHRRIVFEPLRVVADYPRAFGRLAIDEVGYRLPAGLHSERIAV